MTRVFACFIACLICLHSSQAGAESLVPRSDGSGDHALMQLFVEGSSLYTAGRYKEALAAFTGLQRRQSSAIILYNIGQCLAALGQHSQAIAAFERSLAARIDTPELVRERIAEVRAAGQADLEEALGIPGATGSVAARGRICSRLRCRRSSVDPRTIRYIIRLHQNEYRGAYELARIGQPDLQGRMVVRFGIALDGRVSSAEVVDRSIDHERLQASVLESFQRLSFPARDCGRELVITYPILFLPRQRNGVPRHHETRPTLIVEGSLPSESVRHTIRGNIDALHVSYLEALRQRPALGGRLVARFRVSPEGRVTSFFVTSTHGVSDRAALVSPARSFINGLQFPESAGGTLVHCPLDFRPANGDVARVISP